jgi:hypothetical protein
MNTAEFQDLLLFSIAILWGAKMVLHYQYLEKSLSLKWKSGLPRLLGVFDVGLFFQLLIPLIFDNEKSNDERVVWARRKVIIVIWLFWMSMISMEFFFYFKSRN